ncbi:hypothetical protein MNAN1_000310 [Malassezia nana]|uniref:Magnesium transporter NIPA-domain-containing protein n=1 Tax=Malassezia nana TaxID=180528 RepID=A0AAF0J0Z9_9BASI|nr:hypothetical protein MNAN1_000310 [Malassezia nana]
MLGAPQWWAGMAVTIASNVLISLALNCQKLAHMRLDAQPMREPNEQTPLVPLPDDRRRPSYLRSRLWWFGFTLMALGETGNFLAYGLAPASLVSPLGAVSLLSNVIIAPTLLHEPLLVLDVIGLILAMIGALAVVCSIGPSASQPLDPSALAAALVRPTFVVYACAALAVGITLLLLCYLPFGQRSLLVHVGVCGVFGGFTVLATKGVSSLLVQARDARFLRTPLFYLLVAVLLSTALLQLMFLNRALQRFDSRHVIPTQFVLFTVSTIVGSSILYRDLAALRWPRMVGFLIGCLCTFLGVFVLTCDFDSNESAPSAAPTIVVDDSSGIQGAASPPPSGPVDVPGARPGRRHLRSQSLSGAEPLRRSSLRQLASTLFGGGGGVSRSSLTGMHERASLRAMQRRRLRSNPSILAELRTDDTPVVLGLSPGRHLLVSGTDTPLSQSPTR